MTSVCPYCRAPLEAEDESTICEACATPHHADCYAENGGCTVFGCSAAPADEQKVSVTRRDIAAPIAGAAPAPTVGNLPTMLPGIGLTPPGWNPNAPPKPVKAPPPPLPPGVVAAAPQLARPAPRVGVGSMFFDGNPVPAPASSAAPSFDFDLEPDPNAKNRSTFIVLGALLGFFGAHNFYAGYKRKAVMQLCLTAFTLGFAGIMSWVWAVIDVCTVDRDSTGVKFKS